MRNLESVITRKGTDSIHTLIIGKEITGQDALSYIAILFGGNMILMTWAISLQEPLFKPLTNINL